MSSKHKHKYIYYFLLFLGLVAYISIVFLSFVDKNQVDILITSTSELTYYKHFSSIHKWLGCILIIYPISSLLLLIGIKKLTIDRRVLKIIIIYVFLSILLCMIILIFTIQLPWMSSCVDAC